MSGELANITYCGVEVSSGGMPVYHVVYQGDRYVSGSTNLLVRSGARVQPTAMSDKLIQADQSYTIPAHVYHQTIVSEAISVATLVCMHSGVSGAVKVLGLDGYPDRIEFQRRRCSAIEAAKCI